MTAANIPAGPALVLIRDRLDRLAAHVGERRPGVSELAGIVADLTVIVEQVEKRAEL